MPERTPFAPVDAAHPNFFLVPGQNQGRYPYAHSLLVRTEDQNNSAVIVDTGPGNRVIRRVIKNFKVQSVYLSHWHEDHIAGNKLLLKSGSTFFCHELDCPILKDTSRIQDLYGTSGTPVGEYFAEMLETLNIIDLQAPKILHGGQVEEFSDGTRMEVIHTPGHTQGHCCFYFSEPKLVFLADVDLSGLGPWYGGLDSDVNAFEASLQELLTREYEFAVTSHKGLFTGPEIIKEELQAYLNVIYLRDQKILSEMGETKPATLEDLIGKGIIYRRYDHIAEYLFIAERIMIGQHLERLTNQGKLRVENQGFILN